MHLAEYTQSTRCGFVIVCIREQPHIVESRPRENGIPLQDMAVR
jgi:hypothetical protein